MRFADERATNLPGAAMLSRLPHRGVGDNSRHGDARLESDWHLRHIPCHVGQHKDSCRYDPAIPSQDAIPAGIRILTLSFVRRWLSRWIPGGCLGATHAAFALEPQTSQVGRDVYWRLTFRTPPSPASRLLLQFQDVLATRTKKPHDSRFRCQWLNVPQYGRCELFAGRKPLIRVF
jgi:hypothetical protein